MPKVLSGSCSLTDGPILHVQVQPNVNPYDPYSARTCCNGPIESLKWILKQQSAPSETAAIIVEPIMGEGGFLTPPPSFLPALRKICDENGIVLIIDEVTFWHPHPATAVSSTSCLKWSYGHHVRRRLVTRPLSFPPFLQ